MIQRLLATTLSSIFVLCRTARQNGGLAPLLCRYGDRADPTGSLLLARNCTLATLPFQHVKKENRPGRVDAQCGAARVGATLEGIHDMKMESWIMRVLSITVTILGQTWDLEAGYARDEWT